MPAFETANGHYLSESNAIAFFLSNESLRGGKCPFAQAQVQQWLSFADNEIVPASCALVFPLLGIMPMQKGSSAREEVNTFMEILDKKLLNCTFLVGERLTLADIVVFCSLLHLYQHVFDPSFRQKSYINVTRWFGTILNQKQVQAVIRNYVWCEKALVYDPKKYGEYLSKSGGGKGGQQKSAKEQQPKAQNDQQQPKKAANKEGDLDPTEEALAAEPKSNDPFKALPKSTFDFDAFKRFYSNEEETKSIAYFWEHFDPVNCSIWFGEYKYNDELTKTFMSCNLISGMFQRLDKMRKESFSSVCLFGEDNNSTISGVWVWRGQGLAFELSPDWGMDYDVYAWRKLDPAAEETKKLVEQYFSWVGTDKDGRKFNQGKIFKWALRW